MREHIKNIKHILDTYERLLSAVALFIGFIIDSLTLRRIDLLFENSVLITYLLVAGVCIIVLNFRKARIVDDSVRSWVMAVVPFVMQIAFGALFSGFVVFYFRSASFSANFLFILFLFGMLVGNEVFRPYYERLVFHVSIFFFALLSYCLFAVPIVLHSLGALVFLASIVASVVAVSLFIFVLSIFSRDNVRKSLPRIAQSITAIVAVVMFAYLTNIIPPIPLSLKESIIAHAATRSGEAYALSVEPESFFERLYPIKTFHQSAGESVYLWVSVFAPTNLKTAIVHEWQQRQKGKWVTMSRITFPISGGRSEGFRGYSVKESVAEGEWRVSVETERGQVIGRVRFDIIDVPVRPQLLSVTR